MPFVGQQLLKRHLRALPKIAVCCALLMALYMLLQLAQHGRPPYTDYLPVFLAATAGCTLLVFILRCAYTLLRPGRPGKNLPE